MVNRKLFPKNPILVVGHLGRRWGSDFSGDFLKFLLNAKTLNAYFSKQVEELSVEVVFFLKVLIKWKF